MSLVLDVEIRPNEAVQGARTVKRSLDDIGRSATTMESTVGSSVGRLKGLLVGLGAAFAVKELANGFLDAAISVENYKTALNAVVKDVGKTEQIFKELNEWAAINPIDTTDAIAAFVRLKTAAVSNTSEAVKAAADLATVMQTSVSDVAGAIVSTETETLRRLGVILDRSGKMATIQSRQVKISVEKDIDSIRAGIIEVLQRNFQGAMQAAGDTWRGSLNTMSGMWTKLMQDVMGSSSSGGPFDLVSNKIRELRDGWSSWMQSSDYQEFIGNVQTLATSAIEGLSVLADELAGGLGLVLRNMDELTLALKTGAAAWITYHAALALATMSFAPWLSGVVAWLSLAPLAITSMASMGSWLSLLGVAMGPAGILAMAVGAGVFLELRDQMKRAQEQAEITKTAIEYVSRAFADADASTLKSEIDSVTARLDEMKRSTQEAAREMLRLSTMQFEMSNGALSGSIGAAVKAIREGNTNEAKREIAELEAMLDALVPKYEAATRKEVSVGAAETPLGAAKEASGPSAAEKLVSSMRDKMQYLNADGEQFLGTLDGWISRSTTLSADWKKLVDLKQDILGQKAREVADETAAALSRQTEQTRLLAEAQSAAAAGAERFWGDQQWEYGQGMLDDVSYFDMLTAKIETLAVGTDEWKRRFEELQSVASSMASTNMASLNDQLRQGALSTQEYAAAVERLRAEYEGIPLAIRQLDSDLVATKETSDQFGMSAALWSDRLASGLADAIVNAQDLGDALTNIAKQIASSALQKLIGGWIDGFFADGAAFSGGQVLAYADGGVFPSASRVTPYARGGVVNKPTIFPMARGLGLMGEAGPEAVMPLKSRSDGKLGVEASGGSGGTTINNFNISAVDAKSFADMVRRNPGAIVAAVGSNYQSNGAMRRVIKGS